MNRDFFFFFFLSFIYLFFSWSKVLWAINAQHPVVTDWVLRVIEQLVVDGTAWSRTKKKSMLIGIFCQLSEVGRYPAVSAGSDICCLSCSLGPEPSACLGLHSVTRTRGASVLGCRIVTLSPPFPAARFASRPWAPAAPVTVRLGSCMDNFPGDKEVSVQAGAWMVEWGPSRCPRVLCNLSLGKCLRVANPDLCAHCLALNLKLWMEWEEATGSPSHEIGTCSSTEDG